MVLFIITTRQSFISSFFFFNDTATTEIYTLSLHDALPISPSCCSTRATLPSSPRSGRRRSRSEEHTSELQSPCNLVCRLLLEKKKKRRDIATLLYDTILGNPRTFSPPVCTFGPRLTTRRRH